MCQDKLQSAAGLPPPSEEEEGSSPVVPGQAGRDGRNVGGTSEEEGRRRNVGGGGRRFFELGDGGTSEEVDETDEGLGENELQIDGKVWQIKCVR